MGFPKGFVWGAATSSYQIEGAAYEDGKGLSIWDTCCEHPGLVRDFQNADVACDHYHRYPEDIGLLKEMGVDAYRFSLSWPRILPEGTGAVNEKGLDFYDRLIDGLCEAGVAPYVTLYHWDLPYELYKRGGWLNRDIAGWFAEYTQVVAERFCDRVEHWMTLNEPQCFIGLGMQTGRQAPYLTLPQRDVLAAAHHALLAHGRSVQTLRATAKRPLQIGFAPVGGVCCPASHSPQDIAAAREEMFRTDRDSLFNAAWWSDPIFLGRYPEDGLAYYGKHMPRILSGDMETIRQPLDFYGVNIYNADRAKAGPDGKAVLLPWADGFPRNNCDWPIIPESLYWGPRFLYERYQSPILVTENGFAGLDWISEDGKCHDPQRMDYLSRYLGALEQAHQDGVKMLGYFVWSLMDNFEWAEGYYKRFGMVHVDFETQKRTPKDSFYWYRDYIARQR